MLRKICPCIIRSIVCLFAKETTEFLVTLKFLPLRDWEDHITNTVQMVNFMCSESHPCKKKMTSFI